MSVLEWPPELPTPTRAAYAQQRQDIRQRKRGGGPPGYQRRFSSAAKIITLGIEATRARKAIFDRFYDNVTEDGTLPFWMPDPTSDGIAVLDDAFKPLGTTQPAPLLVSSRWLCIFGEPVPSERLLAGRYEIVFTVAVMP